MRLIDADALKENLFKYSAPEMVWDRADLNHKIDEVPTIEPEQKTGKWIEKFDRIIRELGVNCAYDMPSFWCNQGKDYKVIPTKYHKGYMQALADVEKRMKGAEE